MIDADAKEELAGLLQAVTLVQKELRPKFRIFAPPEFFYRVAKAAGATYRARLQDAVTGDRFMGIEIEVIPGLDRYPIVCRADGLIARLARSST